MKKQATVYGPFCQIVTMDGLPESGPITDDQLQVINEGGIRVIDGIISEIGSYKNVIHTGDKLIEQQTPSVVLPGLIDAHTHMCWAGSRAKDYSLRLSGLTYQEIAQRGGGILDTVKKTRQASLEELTSILLTRAEEHFNRGITTCEVKSGYGLTVDDELKMLQAISIADKQSNISLIPTCLAAHMRPWEYQSNKDYLEMIITDLLPRVKLLGLTNRVDIFVEKGAFTEEEAINYLLRAKDLGFDTCIHADQFSRGGSTVAAAVGAISADHLENSENIDLKALKDANVVPIVLPGASLGLGIPFAPARAILDEGLPLVIASDWNPGSAPQGDLLMQASVLGAYEKLTMAETWASITCRACKPLGLNDRGVLRKGMRGDMAMFPTDDYREILYHQGALGPKNQCTALY